LELTLNGDLLLIDGMSQKDQPFSKSPVRPKLTSLI
jgi:hypothetical protein